MSCTQEEIEQLYNDAANLLEIISNCQAQILAAQTLQSAAESDLEFVNMQIAACQSGGGMLSMSAEEADNRKKRRYEAVKALTAGQVRMSSMLVKFLEMK